MAIAKSSLRARNMKSLPVAASEYFVSEPKYKNVAEMKLKLHEKLPGLSNPEDRIQSLNYDRIIIDHERRTLPRVSRVMDGLKLPSIFGEGSDDNRGQKNESPTVRKTSKGAYMSYSKRASKTPIPHLEKSVHGIVSKTDNKQQDVAPAHVQLRSESDAFLGCLDPNRRLNETTGDNFNIVQNGVDLNPTFILVHVLERGQYFGLEDMVLTDSQPSLSVVSNGAECILLSKSFFTEHLTESCLRELRKLVIPYPSDSELQEKLQDYTDWRHLRASTYNQLVAEHETNKERLAGGFR